MKNTVLNALLKILLIVIIFLQLFNKIYAFKVNTLTIEPIDDINNINNSQKVDGLTVIDKDGTMFTYVESESEFIEQTNAQKGIANTYVENVDTTWTLLDNFSTEVELNGAYFNYNTEFTNLPSTVTQTVLEITYNYAKIQLQDIGTTSYGPTPVSFSNHENWPNAPNLQIQKNSSEEILEGTTLIVGEYYKITANTPAGGADLSFYGGINYYETVYKAIGAETISSDVKLFASSLEKTTFSNLDPPINLFTYKDGSIAKDCHEYYVNYGNLTNGREDGAYIISVDGTKSKQVYCDMTYGGASEGGWTLVMKIQGGFSSDTNPLPIQRIADEQGNINSCLTNLDNNCSAKLSDEDINILAGNNVAPNNESVYRLSSPNMPTVDYFVPRKCIYSQVDAIGNTNNANCRKMMNSFTFLSSPEYDQCEAWGDTDNITGIDGWYNCDDNGYTTGVATGHYINSSSAEYVNILDNESLRNIGNTTTGDDVSSGNSVYMWVKNW